MNVLERPPGPSQGSFACSQDFNRVSPYKHATSRAMRMLCNIQEGVLNRASARQSILCRVLWPLDVPASEHSGFSKSARGRQLHGRAVGFDSTAPMPRCGAGGAGGDAYQTAATAAHSLERDGKRVNVLDARVAFIRPYVSHIKAEDALETYVSFLVLCKYVV